MSHPDTVFRPPYENLSQGDIVLAPTAILWSAQSQPPEFGREQHAPEIGNSILIPVWDQYAGGENQAPVVSATVRWGPAMVISHDCEIDKEFLREYNRLRDLGLPEEVAHAQASEDPTLDRHILVAPVLPLSDFPESDHDGLRDHSRIGYLALPGHVLSGGEETVVDLSRVSTTERRLVEQYERLVSLSPVARGVLRFKLSETLAYRGLSVIAQLEGAIGQRIQRVEVQQRSRKSSSLVVWLENGENLHVEIRKPRSLIGDAITRIRQLGG